MRSQKCLYWISVVAVLVASLAGLVAAPSGGVPLAQAAQSAEMVRVVAVASVQEPVEAWSAAFTEMTGVSVTTSYVETDEDVVAFLGEQGADVVFSGAWDLDGQIMLDCAQFGQIYLPLPGLPARTIDSSGCGDDAPDPALLESFMKMVISPDGQQIAIDLGLLPSEVEIVDQAGNAVVVPQPVRRIASGYGVATYYAYAVGVGDQIVAGTYVGVRGPAAQDTFRKIDPDFDTKFNALSTFNQSEINIEELAALQPDLVLASTRTEWIPTVEELGIPVLGFEGESPDRLKSAVLMLGYALGPHARYLAEQFNDYYDTTLADIVEQTSAIDATPSVYFSGTEPLRTASRDMYQTAMIEAAGGESVSDDLTGYWNDVNLEQVLVWDPDVIFVPTYGGASVEAITGSDEWGVIPAVGEGRVYQLPSFISPWDTPVPDSILGIIWMAETLFPELDLQCEAQVTHFYNRYYDYDISAEEAQGLCE